MAARQSPPPAGRSPKSHEAPLEAAGARVPSLSAGQAFVKRTIELPWAGRKLRFEVPADLFSSNRIDPGTGQLLRSIAAAGSNWENAIDLGCGWGPVAVALAAGSHARQVEALDRDALAVESAAYNARLNGCSNVTCRGGLAWDDARGPYDLVATNLPAKAGEPVHRLMLLGASRRLAPEGEVRVVVILPLAESMDRILAAREVQILERKVGREYALYTFRFNGLPALVESPYRRAIVPFTFGDLNYTIESVHGLPDFDTLPWDVEIAVKLLEKRASNRPLRRVAVFEPSQGHAPVILARLHPEIAEIVLFSRDLLALRASAANLSLNRFGGTVSSFHALDTSGLHAPANLDALLLRPRPKEGLAVFAARLNSAFRVHPGCTIILGASAPFAGQLEKSLSKQGRRPSARLDRKGFRALAFTA